jgi:hypothetical protein
MQNKPKVLFLLLSLSLDLRDQTGESHAFHLRAP